MSGCAYTWHDGNRTHACGSHRGDYHVCARCRDSTLRSDTETARSVRAWAQREADRAPPIPTATLDALALLFNRALDRDPPPECST